MSDKQHNCRKTSTWSKKNQPDNGQSQDVKPKRVRLNRSHLFPQARSQLSDVGKETNKTESPASEEAKEIPSASVVSPTLMMESSGSVCSGDAEQPPCSSVELVDSSFEPQVPQSNEERTDLLQKESPASEEVQDIPSSSCVSPALMMEITGSVCSGDAEQPPCSSVELVDSICEHEVPQSSGECTVLPEEESPASEEVQDIPSSDVNTGLMMEITGSVCSGDAELPPCSSVELVDSSFESEVPQSSEECKKQETPSDLRPGLKRKHSGSDAEQPPCKRFKKEEKPQSCTVLPVDDDEMELFVKALEELRLDDSVETHLETAEELEEITTPDLRPGVKRKHSGSDAEQPPCKRFKKEEKPQSCTVLPANGSPASGEMTQTPSVKSRSERKKRAPLNVFSSFEPPCNRAKLHHG
ncbi:fibrous sheath CABYR-binding protein-like isoform X2 [Hemibagrus wyckioides]|uniref:fibrous sheath CABYR-binding protein-like isoform X2 n=1 Tax=Hemibagrus wyckioides TaxID=337641 RepID=UPI00266D08BF|nr:fibrous sheath CABYR-binding protein-like isoform X2 [Hemibagrus wyckioides]